MASKGVGKIRGIYQRGQVFWFQPPQKRGFRPKPFSLETENEGEAMAKVLEWQSLPELAELGEWNFEVQTYLKDQLDHNRMSEHTVFNRRILLKQFREFTGEESPSRVRPEMLQRWYNHYKHKNEQTAWDYVSHVRAFFNWMIQEKKLRENPAAEVKMKKVMKSPRKDFVVRQEAFRLLAAARLETRRAKASKAKNRDGLVAAAREMELFLLMGFDAGLRKNEMVEARPPWFERPASLTVEKTATFKPKDRDERTIPLTNRFKRFLRREFPKGLPAPWVIRPEKKPEKFRYRYEPKKKIELFMKRWKATSNAGKRVGFHMMRHSFASNRLICGVDAFRVAEWLGDTMETMQWHYGHLLENDPEINRGV